MHIVSKIQLANKVHNYPMKQKYFVIYNAAYRLVQTDIGLHEINYKVYVLASILALHIIRMERIM